MLSKVYVKIDEHCRIIQCEGGIKTPDNLTGWIKIDEGTGDKYNLCQSHYFDDGLYTNTTPSVPRYKLVDGKPMLRSKDEIEADRLPNLRAAKQQKNKKSLASWLAAHPLTWTDGKVYGVTEQDQTEMAFNLTKYQLQSSAQEQYVLEWHPQKKERHTFTFEQYKALFLAIDSYVDPYRRHQESIKQAIYEANTAEEINAIQIDYSTVGN